MIYTGQNLKFNTFGLGLKNISISDRLDHGQEEKIIYITIFLPLNGGLYQNGTNTFFFRSVAVEQRRRSCYFQVLA